jgi:YHS domain-containing protein
MKKMKNFGAALAATLILAGCSSHSRQSSSTNSPSQEARARPVSRSGIEVDPVCGMEVAPRVSPREEDKGQTFYFCSEGREEDFKKSPAAYLRPAPTDVENKVK